MKETGDEDVFRVNRHNDTQKHGMNTFRKQSALRGQAAENQVETVYKQELW